LLDRELSRRISSLLGRSYETLIWVWLSWIIKTVIYSFFAINRGCRSTGEVRRRQRRFGMGERRRSFVDRRSGEDRRRVHNLDYFSNGGVERRSGKERRSKLERRNGWIRVSDWVSVFVRNLKITKSAK
jgi:hypothetical protein